MGKRQSFPHVFKVEAVRLLERGDKPAAEVARRLVGACFPSVSIEGTVRAALPEDLLARCTTEIGQTRFR